MTPYLPQISRAFCLSAAHQLPIEVDDVGFVVGLVEQGVEHGGGECLGGNKLREKVVGQVVALPNLPTQKEG